MHCVQYVALSRADLQRWQNVRPHLMHAPAKPASAALEPEHDGARMTRQQRADRDRVAQRSSTDRTTRSCRTATRATPRRAIVRRHCPRLRDRRVVDDDLLRRRRSASSRSIVRAVDLLGLIELLRLLVELVQSRRWRRESL